MTHYLGAAILLALLRPATQLSVQPWVGPDFQAAGAAAATYRLQVSGRAGATMRLEASHVAPGWLAAFCTRKLCSPQRISVSLPRSGRTVLQFELVRESANAPKRSGATISDGAGASVSVPAAFRG